MHRLIAVFAFALSIALAGNAVAAAFDGNWRVSVVTEKGECDRGYAYDVAVAGGQVRYRGPGAPQVSGTVSPKGAVKVRITVGEHGATVNGRMGATTGVGTWRGIGPNASCSGRWEAERR